MELFKEGDIVLIVEDGHYFSAERASHMGKIVSSLDGGEGFEYTVRTLDMKDYILTARSLSLPINENLAGLANQFRIALEAREELAKQWALLPKVNVKS